MPCLVIVFMHLCFKQLLLGLILFTKLTTKSIIQSPLPTLPLHPNYWTLSPFSDKQKVLSMREISFGKFDFQTFFFEKKVHTFCNRDISFVSYLDKHWLQGSPPTTKTLILSDFSTSKSHSGLESYFF